MLSNGQGASESLAVLSPALPRRSRLFHLEPVGAGTPYVESLSGYASRLAEKHSTTLYRLFSEEVAPLINKPGTISHRVSFGSFAKAVNGTGVIASDLVDVLERLTLRCDLRFTTLLPLADVISSKGLTREERAWCPACYDECLAEGADLYDQLLWTIQCVTVCAKHGRPLEFVCPHCMRGQKVLSHAVRPGFCARCHRWLGSRPRAPHHPKSINSSEAFGKELARAEEAGKLLAAAPELQLLQAADRLTRNLRALMSSMFTGRSMQPWLAFPAAKQTVRAWLQGTQTPTLLLLLDACSALGVSAAEMLRSEHEGAGYDAGAVAPAASKTCRGSRSRGPSGKPAAVNWKDAESATRAKQRLRSALDDNPPTSLAQVAKELGCARGTLRKKFPELAAQVAAKAFAFYRPSVSDERMSEEFAAALAENPPPPLADVSRRLGDGASIPVLHKRFPEESRKVVERYRAHKKRRLDDGVLEKELLAATIMEPAPSLSEVSRRLGVAVPTLYSKFPELCNAISGRFAARRREKSESNRAVAKAEVREMCERALREGKRPSFTLIRRGLSVPCQPEYFSRIWREALAELNVDDGKRAASR